jgi:lysophospholipase L1-like esterase
MGRAAKIVALNVCVFIGLFFAIMLIVSVSADLVRIAKSVVGAGDSRGRDELPMLAMDANAPRVFAEQRDTVSVYAPIVGWRKAPFRGEFVNIDENGLRTHTIGLDNLPSAKSIGFFGGSTVWGTGVADNGTIPALFDSITNDYAVTNFGERGWRSRQSLAELVNLYNQGKLPDVVVFYSGANDVAIGCDLAFGPGYNETHESPYLRELIGNRESSSYLYRNFVVPAWDTFQRLTKRQKVASDRRCDVDPERAHNVALTMFRNWQLAKLITESNGKKFYAFLQPVAGVGKPNISYLKLDQNALDQYPPVYQSVRSLIAAEGGGWAFDISDAFDGSNQYYIDPLHVTDEGNAIIAKRILDRL